MINKRAGIDVPHWQLLDALQQSGASRWLALRCFDSVQPAGQAQEGRLHLHSVGVCGPLDADFRVPSLVYDERAKSFHLDTCCFDSRPERQLFWDLLREKRVKKLYFTGMLTHGQSDFFIQYFDPDSCAVRSYYPDFLFLRAEPDGTERYVIVEVKADNQIAEARGMEYRIIKAGDAANRDYRILI